MNQQALHQNLGSVGFTAAIQHVRDIVEKGFPGSSPSALLFLPIVLYPVANTLCRKIKDDYELFLSLGPGGTPSTPLGYVKVQILKFLIANHDIYTPPKHDPANDKPGAFFQSVFDLPSRKGARPQIAGIAPQRQVSQRSNDTQIAALQACMRALAAENSETVETGRSCFEKQSLALFLKDRPTAHGDGHSHRAPAETNVNFSDLHVALAHSDSAGVGADDEPINATCGLPPEVAHMHGSEGSLHLTLHPEDAAVVLQRGWGERHPLAGAGGLMRDIFNGRGMNALYGEGQSEGWLPRGFVMVYAPRSEEERRAVGKIVRAAAWWVGGVKLRESPEF